VILLAIVGSRLSREYRVGRASTFCFNDSAQRIANMTISFPCEECGQSYRVPDDKAGKKVKSSGVWR
jgi:hypothetical protein